jgi:hypothetical protein
MPRRRSGSCAARSPAPGDGRPPGLIGLATDFGLGQALIAGKIAAHPAVMRFGARVAREGGGDVDATWTRPAPAAR